MTHDELQVLLDHHTDAWNRHDPEALAANHAEDGIVVSPMFGLVDGRRQIAKSYATLFAVFPDWTIRFDDPIVEGHRVAYAFTVSATQQGEFMGMPSSGRRCTFDGVSLVRVNDVGLITEERRRYDFTGLLTQLGVFRVKLAK
jgi:steroid delta-isomerase-like uncharacterized protein